MPGGTRYQQGNEILDQMLYSPTVTFPTLGANASSTTAITLNGVIPGDMIGWNMQAPPAHLVIDNVYVSAPNVLQVQWGTDGTGVTGATVAVLWTVCRGDNTNLGITSLPAALV